MHELLPLSEACRMHFKCHNPAAGPPNSPSGEKRKQHNIHVPFRQLNASVKTVGTHYYLNSEAIKKAIISIKIDS